MSKTVVTLANQKKNEIEFEMEVEGLTVNPSDIRFVIETSEMDYAFKCTKKKGNVCTVTIPPLPQLEKTLYPFRIETVIDGYHFIPMEGQVNVTGSFDVYTSEPKNRTVAPPTKAKAAPKKSAEEKKVAKTDGKKLSDLVKKVAGDTTPAAKKEEKKSPKVTTTKDVKEDVLTDDIASVQADKIVKDAIQTIRDSKIVPRPAAKEKTKPFFNKVSKKQEVVETPKLSEKDKAIHNILENQEAQKEGNPTVAFKKGKRVKN